MNKVENFFKKAVLKKFKKRTILLRPDEPVSKIFYLKSGNVRQYIISPSGEEFIVHVFKPGSFFPIAMVLGEIENRFYFEALNDIEVKIVTPAKVLSFLQKDPEVLLDLTKRLSRGLNGVIKRFEEFTGKPAKDRLLSLLTYLSESFGQSASKGRTINLSLTHQDLAGWLGLSRETVSRQMKKLSKEKAIKQKNKTIEVYPPKKDSYL